MNIKEFIMDHPDKIIPYEGNTHTQKRKVFSNQIFFLTDKNLCIEYDAFPVVELWQTINKWETLKGISRQKLNFPSLWC